MKRDKELMREILARYRDGDLEDTIQGHEDASVRYHKGLLIEAGLAKGLIAKDYTRPTDVPVSVVLTGVTESGHDFLEALETPTSQAKDVAAKAETGEGDSGTIWDSEDFSRYFSSLMQEYAEQNGKEAQELLQKGIAALVQSPGSGPLLARLAREYAEKGLCEPPLETVDIFERAFRSLGVTPTEIDFDRLQRRIEDQIRGSKAHVTRQIDALYRRHANMDVPTRLVEQVEASGLREMHRRIERRKLELHHGARQTEASLGATLIAAFDEVNRRARTSLDFALFHTASYQATQDVARSVRTRDELIVSLQALAVLLDQINVKVPQALKSLDRVPDGGINRVETLLVCRKIAVPAGTFDLLRDVRRLANDYPRHPGSREVEAAVERLGIVLPFADPAGAWSKVLGHTIDALSRLASALGAHTDESGRTR